MTIIERFMILHLNLLELCSGKQEQQQFDEMTSDDELLEPILYFYSSKQQKQISSSSSASIYSRPNSIFSIANTTTAGQNITTTTTTNNTEIDQSSQSNINNRSYDEEAIQFAGLCTALYGLPQVLSKSNSNTSKTSVVQLSNCILVFQPLEEHLNTCHDHTTTKPLIVAIAQIAKKHKQQRQHHHQQHFGLNNRNYNTGTPSAVSAAIQRHHNLFCYLRGGGIHERLHTRQQHPPQHLQEQHQKQQKLSTSNDLYKINNRDNEVSNLNPITTKETFHYNDSSCYGPMMNRLFDLRKRRSQLIHKIKRSAYNNNYDNECYDDDDDDDTSDSDNNEDDGEASNQEPTVTSSQTKLPAQDLLKQIEIELYDMYYYQQLPIRLLKEDLRIHYDSFIGSRSSNYNNNSHIDGGGGMYYNRNIVECIPPTLPPSLPNISSTSVPCATSVPMGSSMNVIHPDSVVELSVTIRKLLSSLKQANETPNEPHLLGVTSYLNGQMILPYTQTIPNNDNSGQNDDNDPIPSVYVPNETSKQLMLYLAEFQCQMHQKKQQEQQHPDVIKINNNNVPGGKLYGFLKPPALSLLSSLDDNTNNTFDGPANFSNTSSILSSSSSVSLSPLSLFSSTVGGKKTNDEIVSSSNSTTPQQQNKVWAPTVWLPYDTHGKRKTIVIADANRINDNNNNDDNYDDDEEMYSHSKVRMCLFYYNNFSFLLFLNHIKCVTATQKNNEDVYRPLFQKIQEYIVTGLDLIVSSSDEVVQKKNGNNITIRQHNTHLSGTSGFHQPTTASIRPGQTIISIDRCTESVFLFTDPKQNQRNYPNRQRVINNNGNNNHRQPTPPTTIDRLGMNQFVYNSPTSSPHRSSNIQRLSLSPTTSHQRISSSYPANYISGSSCIGGDPYRIGFDCRHQLASHLSLDSLLAFEDAMDEVRRYRHSITITARLHGPDRPTNKANTDNDDNNSFDRKKGKPFEMSTLLPGRWIYVYAHGDKELYALFDCTYFVTISDVQQGAERIRNELWGM